MVKARLTTLGRNVLRILILGGVVAISIPFVHAIGQQIEKATSPDIGTFSITDIRYEDFYSLRANYRGRKGQVERNLNELKDLADKYPEDKELLRKIERHEAYLDRLECTEFPCRQGMHCPTDYKCPVCKGKGTTGRWLSKKTCGTCHGEGRIRRPCQYCKSYSPGSIPAREL